MNKKDRNIYIFLLLGFIIFSIIGFYLGWLDNGPKPLF